MIYIRRKGSRLAAKIYENPLDWHANITAEIWIKGILNPIIEQDFETVREAKRWVEEQLTPPRKPHGMATYH